MEQFSLDDQMNSCTSEENVNEDFLAEFEESGFVSEIVKEKNIT